MGDLRAELVVLVPLLVGLGEFEKRIMGAKPKSIPFTLLAFGIILAAAWGFITTEYLGWRMVLDAAVVTGVMQGGLAAFAAMGLYDTAKSAAKKE